MSRMQIAIAITGFVSLAILTTGSILAQPTGDTLDRDLAAVFRDKCVMCHDHRDGDAGGDVDFLLDFIALVNPDNYQFDADDPTASRLQEVLEGEDPEMPKRQMKEVQWNGPLDAQQLDVVTRWIERGGPSQKYREHYKQLADRQIINQESVAEAITLDLLALSGKKREFARYLTLTNLHNNQSIAADALELYRQGVVKLLNSLSRSPDILGMDDASTSRRIASVDETRTIFRFDLRDIGWEHQDWSMVVAHYPYGQIPREGMQNVISSATPSPQPVMRGDWFVFATSQPPLYHDLLKIEPTLGGLEDRLGVNRAKNIRDGRVVRAGFSESGVSQNNRMVERHAAGTSGAYWISYDFEANTGAQDLFQNPLGPANITKSRFGFQHDGGEAIYSLPNGYQAYLLATVDGRRISIAPNSIVHDDSMRGGQIINGISCMSCHYQGMKPENPAKLKTLDQVRLNADGAFVRFSLEQLERIRELYPAPDQFVSLVEQDRERFLAALRATGITRIGANEPVRALFDQFASVLDVNAAAAEFGLSVATFEELMNRNESTRRILQRMKVAGLKRQKYVTTYQNIAPQIGMGIVREFTPLPLPFFGSNPDDDLVSTQTAGLLNAYHQGGKLSVTMKALGDKDLFREGENVECEIRANETCFVTVVSTDSSGETTLLLPNAHHSSFKIEPGRRYVFPTPKMVRNGMELVVSEPHGATSMKVIATKRPLPLAGVTPARLATEGLIVLKNAEGDRDLTTISIDKHFSPNEWATARWTCKTKPN